MKPIHILTLIGCMAFVSVNAYAQSTDVPTADVPTTGGYVEVDASAQFLQTEELRQLTRQDVGAIEAQIDRRMLLAALPHEGVQVVDAGWGNALSQLSHTPLYVWSSYSFRDMENDGAFSAYDGDNHHVSIGVDKKIHNSITAGLSLSYADSQTQTPQNAFNRENTGFTISPYASVSLDKQHYISVSAGWNWAEQQTDWQAVGVGTVTGETDSQRYFAHVSANGNYWFEKNFIGWKAGWLSSHSNTDAYVESTGRNVDESDNTLGQASFGLHAGRYMALPDAYGVKAIMPKISVTYQNDMVRDDPIDPRVSDDDDQFYIHTNMNIIGNDTISGGVSFGSSFGREDYEDYVLGLNIRLKL